MKRWCLALLLISIVSSFNCSPDDEVSNPEDGPSNERIRLIDKVEFYRNGLFFDMTVDYDSENRITKLVTTKYQGLTFLSEITVSYTGNVVSSITDVTQFENPFVRDDSITYNVFFEDNVIRLLSDETGVDISHTNGYVDSITEYFTENMGVFDGMVLKRNANDDLLETVDVHGSVVNTYRDFDIDKKTDLYGIVIDVMFQDYLLVLGLKLTKNNPTTSAQSILGSPEVRQNFTYEYDSEGYVTRTYEGGAASYLDIVYKE